MTYLIGTPREVEQATAERHDQSGTVRSTVGVLPRVCGDSPKGLQGSTFPMLQEDNTREGFLKDEDYDKLAEEAGKVGLWIRGLLAVYSTYGWRRSEPLDDLRVRQVDLLNQTLDLNPGATKTRMPESLR